MKAVLKIMLFSFILNLAVGIMSTALPAIGNNPQYNPLTYDGQANARFLGEMNGTINPLGNVEDKSDMLDRLLDSLQLGIVKKMLNALSNLDRYFFGVIQLIEKVFGLESFWLSTFLRSLLTAGYAMGAIWLWTGKDIGKG